MKRIEKKFFYSNKKKKEKKNLQEIFLSSLNKIKFLKKIPVKQATITTTLTERMKRTNSSCSLRWILS